MHTDPISDYLARLKNAVLAGHQVVEIPASKMKESITQILYDKGYILNYKVDKEGHPQGKILIALKYDRKTMESPISDLQKVSKPGLRQYVGVDELPKVKNGLGIAILSTSHGVISDKEARQERVGGEVLCYVY